MCPKDADGMANSSESYQFAPTVWALNMQQNGWLAILRVLFNSISVISGGWVGNNERLCAIEHHSWLKRSPPRAGLEPETARSTGQRITYWATGAPAALKTVEFQWLEHFWNHKNMFETGVIRAKSINHSARSGGIIGISYWFSSIWRYFVCCH